MSRILVSGASGFVGTPLVSFLEKSQHQVVPLVRASSEVPKNAIVWDPEKKEAHEDEFEGFDAVIHLAGDPLTLGRWSEEKKERILQSRVMGTMFLSHILSSCLAPPKVFISASAVGFYGNRGEEELTEESSNGDSFLAHVCSAWEEASFALKERGVRCAHTRFGMVLGKGGALKKMLLAYKIGLGAKLGSGEQWISWVDIHDLVRAINHVIETESLSGPVNVVSPCPVRQIEFSKLLAKDLDQPHFLTLPSWLLHLMYGKVADELLLSSAKVLPAKLLASNFHFEYPDLKDSFARALIG